MRWQISCRNSLKPPTVIECSYSTWRGKPLNSKRYVELVSATLLTVLYSNFGLIAELGEWFLDVLVSILGISICQHVRPYNLEFDFLSTICSHFTSDHILCFGKAR